MPQRIPIERKNYGSAMRLAAEKAQAAAAAPSDSARAGLLTASTHATARPAAPAVGTNPAALYSDADTEQATKSATGAVSMLTGQSMGYNPVLQQQATNALATQGKASALQSSKIAQEAAQRGLGGGAAMAAMRTSDIQSGADRTSLLGKIVETGATQAQTALTAIPDAAKAILNIKESQAGIASKLADVTLTEASVALTKANTALSEANTKNAIAEAEANGDKTKAGKLQYATDYLTQNPDTLATVGGIEKLKGIYIDAGLDPSIVDTLADKYAENKFASAVSARWISGEFVTGENGGIDYSATLKNAGPTSPLYLSAKAYFDSVNGDPSNTFNPDDADDMAILKGLADTYTVDAKAATLAQSIATLKKDPAFQARSPEDQAGIIAGITMNSGVLGTDVMPYYDANTKQYYFVDKNMNILKGGDPLYDDTGKNADGTLWTTAGGVSGGMALGKAKDRVGLPAGVTYDSGTKRYYGAGVTVEGVTTYKEVDEKGSEVSGGATKIVDNSETGGTTYSLGGVKYDASFKKVSGSGSQGSGGGAVDAATTNGTTTATVAGTTIYVKGGKQVASADGAPLPPPKTGVTEVAGSPGIFKNTTTGVYCDRDGKPLELPIVDSALDDTGATIPASAILSAQKDGLLVIPAPESYGLYDDAPSDSTDYSKHSKTVDGTRYKGSYPDGAIDKVAAKAGELFWYDDGTTVKLGYATGNTGTATTGGGSYMKTLEIALIGEDGKVKIIQTRDLSRINKTIPDTGNDVYTRAPVTPVDGAVALSDTLKNNPGLLKVANGTGFKPGSPMEGYIKAAPGSDAYNAGLGWWKNNGGSEADWDIASAYYKSTH
jgi:hypothetical protein